MPSPAVLDLLLSKPLFTFDPSSPATNSNVVLGNGNRDMTGCASGERGARTLLPKSSGKWGVELTLVTWTGGTTNLGIGVADSAYDSSSFLGGSARSAMYFLGDINYSNVVLVPTPTASTGMGAAVAGDIYTLLMDLDLGQAYIARNNTFGASQNPTTGANPWLTWTPGGPWTFAVDCKAAVATARLAPTLTYPPKPGFTMLNR